MRLTILGSGNTHGIPAAGCACPACARAAAAGPRRTPTCALVETSSGSLAIDAGRPDAAAADPAAVLLTHHHPDHIDHLAAFAPRPIFGPDDRVRAAAAGPAYRTVEAFATQAIAGAACTPLPLRHAIPTVGWAIEADGRRLAWLCDTFALPATTIGWLHEHPVDLAVIDASFPPGDRRAATKLHNDLPTALAALRAARIRQALLIHVDHSLQTWLDERPGCLPDGVAVATDGMVW